MYQEVQERLKSHPRYKATSEGIHARTSNELCKRSIDGLRSGTRDVATPKPPSPRVRTGMPVKPVAQTIRNRHLVTPARPQDTGSAGIKVRFHV